MASVPLPLTYPDLLCVNGDLDPFGGETTSDLQSLIQDVGHLLQEEPGSNPDDPNRGIGVHLYLNGTVDAFKGLSGLIEAQLSEDDRIDGISCKVTTNPNGTFLLRLDIGVNGTIVPLQYGWQDGNFTNLAGPG